MDDLQQKRLLPVMKNFLSLLIAIFCYLAVPYPYCFKEIARQETIKEIHIFFTKNEFFHDCSLKNNLFIKSDSDKDVVLYLDGKEFERISKEKACLK